MWREREGEKTAESGKRGFAGREILDVVEAKPGRPRPQFHAREPSFPCQAEDRSQTRVQDLRGFLGCQHPGRPAIAIAVGRLPRLPADRQYDVPVFIRDRVVGLQDRLDRCECLRSHSAALLLHLSAIEAAVPDP